MTEHVLEREQFLDRPLEQVFSFFSAAHNLEALTPEWLRFEVMTPEPIEMRVGTLIEYRLSVHGVPLNGVSQIAAWERNRWFVDRQLRGPYRLWHHTHEFVAIGDGTLVRDSVRYAIPFGPLGDVAHTLFVQRDLDSVFAYRRSAVWRLLG